MLYNKYDVRISFVINGFDKKSMGQRVSKFCDFIAALGFRPTEQIRVYAGASLDGGETPWDANFVDGSAPKGETLVVHTTVNSAAPTEAVLAKLSQAAGANAKKTVGIISTTNAIPVSNAGSVAMCYKFTVFVPVHTLLGQERIAINTESHPSIFADVFGRMPEEVYVSFMQILAMENVDEAASTLTRCLRYFLVNKGSGCDEAILITDIISHLARLRDNEAEDLDNSISSFDTAREISQKYKDYDNMYVLPDITDKIAVRDCIDVLGQRLFWNSSVLTGVIKAILDPGAETRVARTCTLNSCIGWGTAPYPRVSPLTQDTVTAGWDMFALTTGVPPNEFADAHYSDVVSCVGAIFSQLPRAE